MQKNTRNLDSIHALRQEFRDARQEKQSIFISVEDAIFTRLIDAEELLIVAANLFTELSVDKTNWLFKYRNQIDEVRTAIGEIVNDRPFV